jgi:hypothetical protein
MSCIVFATIRKEVDLVEDVQVATYYKDYYCLGIKSLKSYCVQSLNIARVSLNAHCARSINAEILRLCR